MSVKEIESQIKDLTRQLNEAKLGEYESMVGKCYENIGEYVSSFYFVQRYLDTGYLTCFFIMRGGDSGIEIDPRAVVSPTKDWYEISREHFQDIWKQISELDPFKI